MSVSKKGNDDVHCIDETTSEYYLLYPRMTNPDSPTQVLEYTHSDEHTDEALTMQTINVK